MNLKLITLSVLTVGLAATCFAAGPSHKPKDLYGNYSEKVQAATAKMHDYFRQHPDHTRDSLLHHVYSQLSEDGQVASASKLPQRRRTPLSGDALYKLGRKSALVYAGMVANPELKMDTVYTNASAVAITADGICATNFHVVADILLGAGLDYKKPNEMAALVMDYDGNVYPVEAILYADPVNDFSIIKVDTGGRKLTPAPLRSDAGPGTQVYCLSNPSGAYFHLTDGIISNCTSTTNERNGQTRYVCEITADYGRGASGGPIFDNCGNLVGIVSQTYSLYAQPEQFRNFQMAYKQTVPAFLIRDCFTDVTPSRRK